MTRNNEEGNAVRPTIMTLAMAALLSAPLAVDAPVGATPGVSAASTEFSSQAKKKKKTEENLKAAPGTGPSGPPPKKK